MVIGESTNGFRNEEEDYPGPFRREALMGEVAARGAASVVAPFTDVSTPFALSELDLDGAAEAPFEDASYAREEEASRCPHCGREDESPFSATEDEDGELMLDPAFHEELRDHKPFLGEDSEEESPFEAAEAFDEEAYGGNAEWEEQELDHVDRLFEAEAELASLSPSELKAVRITSTFETGHAGGFGGLTGNFDGQGLSFGLMNWTIKAGSLIPMLQEFITKHADRFTRIFGSDADRFKAMVLATRRDPSSGRQVRDVAAQMDFVRGKMNDASQKHIVEPWKTYFGGLENDPDFRAIEVEAVRRGLAHAKRWFHRFGWSSERGFVFMFDLVSSHGAYWLDAKKFHGRREKLLADRTAQKKAEIGRDPNELEMMELLANLIADVSLEKWREKVRERKLWFFRGKGKVHKTFHDLAKEFGVTDGPADFGAGSPSSTHEIGMLDAFGDAAKGIGQAVRGIDEGAAVTRAIANGQTDASKLTNLVFFARHPELGGQAIRKGEQALADEWNEILRTIVRPALAKTASTTSQSASTASTTTEVLGIDTSVGWHKEKNKWKADAFKHDWVKAKAQGIVFAIPRACEGTSPDPAFKKDWDDMKAAGIVRGGYLFLRFPHPKRSTPPSPEKQAEFLIKTLDAAGIGESDFPPVLDVEFPGVMDKKTGKVVMSGLKATGMTREELLAGVRAAWEVLKDHYKVAPLIYTSYQVWLDNMPTKDPASDLTESPLWLTPYYLGERQPPLLDPAKVARRRLGDHSWYPPSWRKGNRHDPPIPPPWGDANNWWIHQYQGDAIGLPGFSGDVDMDRFHTMMPGETGDRVKWVQRRLGIPETGSFDSTMETALLSFKTRKGLAGGSVIDPATFARLCWA